MKENKILLIAEACDNHFGSISNAFQMVKKAKQAGADIIKFQHHIPDEEMLRKVPKSSNFKINLYSFLKKYALTLEDHYKIKNYCKIQKIKYLCTPFSLKAALELKKIGVNFYKIGSGEFTDTPFIEQILKFKHPIIFSTGMSTISEIDMMYKFIMDRKKNDVTFMHCISEYPTNIKDLNLKFIPKMINKYKKITIGHSDHTNSLFSSFAAATLGAKYIEKHVYLDGLNFGPDRDVSISFKQLKELKEGLNGLEICLGDQKKIFTKEKKIRKWARRSIVTISKIKKGEKFTYKNLWTKRPGTGIPSYKLKNIIGKISKNNLNKDIILKKNQIR